MKYWPWRIRRHWKWNGEREKAAISPYDPIDDGWTRHDIVFVCLNCLKAFHPHVRNGSMEKCPQCGDEMHDVGPFFAAPSRKTNRGRKAWKNIIEAVRKRDYQRLLNEVQYAKGRAME